MFQFFPLLLTYFMGKMCGRYLKYGQNPDQGHGISIRVRFIWPSMFTHTGSHGLLITVIHTADTSTVKTRQERDQIQSCCYIQCGCGVHISTRTAAINTVHTKQYIKYSKLFTAMRSCLLRWGSSASQLRQLGQLFIRVMSYGKKLFLCLPVLANDLYRLPEGGSSELL